MILKRSFELLSKQFLGFKNIGALGVLRWESPEMWCTHRPLCHEAVESAAVIQPAPPDPRMVMSIAAKSNPFKTLGYLIGRLTEGQRMYMKCTGTQAVYAATKSLAVARKKICDHSLLRGDDICLRIIHQDGAEKDRVSKFVVAIDRVPASSLGSSNPKEEIIRSGARRRVHEIGKSLLLALENDTDVLGKAMGPVGVSIMMAGFAFARGRLKRDGFDLICFPEYRSEEVPCGKALEARKMLNFMFRKIAFEPAADVSSAIGVSDVPKDRHPRKSEVTKPDSVKEPSICSESQDPIEDHEEEELRA